MLKIILIFLLFSTSALANVFDPCARAYWILLDKTAYYISAPFSPKTFALKRKIIRRFSQLGGHRINNIMKSGGLSNNEYFKGLANLALALEETEPIWNKIKLKSIFINDLSHTYFYLGLFELPTISIPYNAVAHSLPLNLSTELLGFGIKRKLKKENDWFFPIKNKGLSDNQYKSTLEAFYNALEKGPVPEELEKLHGINFVNGGDISFSWQHLTSVSVLRPVLNIPSHTVKDLEGVAIGVLESEAAEMLIKDYAYTGQYRNIGSVIVNDGVERKTYRKVLEKMIKRLTETSIAKENLGPEKPDPVDLRNMARIHITVAGGEVSIRQRYDNYFDLYLPADIILNDDPIVFSSPLLLSP